MERPLNLARPSDDAETVARQDLLTAANATEGNPASAYLISQVEVLDADAWENYRTRAARVIADFGGRYFVRGARAAAVKTTNDLCRRHRRAC